MTVIYTPSGRAREYSPKALNVYLGCTHNCKYCYAPASTRTAPESYFVSPSPRKDIVARLQKQLSEEVITEQVLISFVGDAYCESQDNGQVLREILPLLADHHVPVAILTKGGRRCLQDVDLFKEFGRSIMIGATLTFNDDEPSKEWESGAALPSERLEVLSLLKSEGIKTFASFEPVIDPKQSLAVMQRSVDMDCIDLYKVGKLNGRPSIEKTIDWTTFLKEALYILRNAGKEIYVKDDLSKSAPSVILTPSEREADAHTVRWVSSQSFVKRRGTAQCTLF